MMTAFWVISALFVAVALSFVVLPLLANRERVGFSRRATNLSIHRDQLRELDADRDSGTLDPEHYEIAKRELEARLLEDLRDADAASNPPRHGRGAAIAAGFAIPLGAVALYFIVGTPQAITFGEAASAGGAGHEISAQQIEIVVARLAARMAQDPGDGEGWALLGRSYKALGRFKEAAEAYSNAMARLPGDAGVLADYADVLAMAQGRRLQGEPEKLITRALEIDPGNLKALALAGSAAFEAKNFSGAVGYWQRMLPLVPPDSEGARSIQASIAEARSLGSK